MTNKYNPTLDFFTFTKLKLNTLSYKLITNKTNEMIITTVFSVINTASK